MKPQSPLEALKTKPQHFQFDAAVRLLLMATHRSAGGSEHDDPLRFRAPAALGQPVNEVLEIELPLGGQPAAMRSPLIGLTGASGVMPRWYTELLAQAARQKSHGMADFFDLLAQRLISAFAGAGAKYRLNRSSEAALLKENAEEPIGAGLLALTGYGTEGLTDRLAAGADALRYYSGFFAARPRSSDRLAWMVSDYLGRQVEIQEFAGAWLRIPPDQQSRLPKGRSPGAYHALAVDVAIGTRAWDQQARFIVRVGPLNRAEFEALLPDRKRLGEVVSLIRAYVGWEADFAVNLVLAVPEIPPMRLARRDDPTAPRLGWTSWLPATTGRLTNRRFADEAVFGATLVESLN